MSAVETIERNEQTTLQPGYCLMSWPDAEQGDVKKIWNRNNADEVADARRSFNELTKKGFRAFRTSGEKGDRGAALSTFDPEAERMILIPPVVGG